MKKIMLFWAVFACVLSFTACDDPYDLEPRDPIHNGGGRDNGGNNGDNTGGGNGGNSSGQNQTEPQKTYQIDKLYSVVMRRELPYPFAAYVMKLDNGNYYYMLRYRYNQDLKVGDSISFSVFTFCPNEIASINGCDLGDGSSAEGSDKPSAGEYLVASDPIEATVKSMFTMKIRYSITFYPIATRFIETTDGNLVFVKESKFNVDLNAGDRFVYNVYTLFPNEILAIKKL